MAAAPSQKDDPLFKAADVLVPSANIRADAMLTSLLDDYPCLGKAAAIKQWVHISTVAGVFMAATRLTNLRLGDARENEIMDKIYKRFTQWDATNAESAFEDCASFFAKHCVDLEPAGHEPRIVASDAIGHWVVWKVFLRAPKTDEERRLAREIGAIITLSFFDYWETKRPPSAETSTP